MGEPVEERAGQPFGAEDLGPFVEGEIRGHQRRRLLIALGEDLEQPLSAGLRQRHVAELVDDQQILRGELLLHAQQALLIPGLEQVVHARGGGDKAHPIALLTGRQPPTPAHSASCRCRSLPSANTFSRRSRYSERASSSTRRVFNDGIARNSKVSRLFTTGNVAALMRRSVGPLLAVEQLQLAEAEQVAWTVQAFLGAVPGHFVVLAQKGGQAQGLEMGVEQPGRFPPSLGPRPQQRQVARRRGRRPARGRQMRILRQVEPGRPLFDAAPHEMLDGIEADHTQAPRRPGWRR